MRFSRVLLVSPPSSSYLGAARPPQNLGYLSQALSDKKIEYDILDMRLGYHLKHLKRKIDAFEPDLIGITLVSLEYKKSYELISKIKKLYPNIQLVVGGPHITVLQEIVLDECQEIDFGVVYEGEETLIELCTNGKDLSDIKGLIYRKDNQAFYNGSREFNQNLDGISFPKYHHFELNKYIPEIPLNSSRGCPLQCIFCPNKLITKKFRWRSAHHVVNEIEYWYQRGCRIFTFDDDNFSYFSKRVFQICDEIENRGIHDAEFRCSNGLRGDRVDWNLLKRMKEVGFHYIAFGIDGGNNKMLKLNKKGETIETIDLAIKNACDLGFDVKIFCIIGMPYETLEDVEDSLKIVQKYPVKRVNLNNPIPYPGTELFEIVKKNHWFLIEPEIYLNRVTENESLPVFETPEISKNERLKLLKKLKQIEKKITRKAVHRMYQRYSVLGMLAGYFFATDFIEKMFFKNRLFRKIAEQVRHRRMLKNKTFRICE